MAGEAKAPGRQLLRRLTRLLMSPDKLRRSSDRTEAMIVAVLSYTVPTCPRADG